MKKIIVITIVTFALVSLVSCASAQGIVASDSAETSITSTEAPKMTRRTSDGVSYEIITVDGNFVTAIDGMTITTAVVKGLSLHTNKVNTQHLAYVAEQNNGKITVTNGKVNY